MNANKEINVLSTKFNELYAFTLHSIRRAINNSDIEKITWNKSSVENDPDSFANSLFYAGLALFKKNHKVIGNFVLTGKQGFEILKKMGSPRFIFEEDQGIIDSTMKVKYIQSIDDDMFIVSVYEPLNFNDDDDYKKYYDEFPHIEDIVVGKIVDDSCNDNIKAKSEVCNEHDTVMHNYMKCYSKTHLIFGSAGCGKTTLFRQIIKESINRDEDVFVFGSEIYGRLHFNDKSKSKLHFYSPKDVSSFSNKVDPESLAKHIVNFCYSLVGKDNTRTIAIDGFEQFKLNPDYTMSEYFRELTKECRVHNINFLYVLCSNTNDKNGSYHKIPEIYERFSDIITVLK